MKAFHEVTQDMFRAEAAALTLPNLHPQEGDHEQLLLAKICRLLKQAPQRSGIIVDEAGIERRVMRVKANVAAGETDAAVITAVTGKLIRVISVYALAGATATNLTFNSKPAGAGTAISALLANGINGGEVLPRNPDGWFDTVVSEGLTVTTGTGSATGIGVSYILVPNYAVDENGLVLFDEDGNPLTA